MKDNGGMTEEVKEKRKRRTFSLSLRAVIFGVVLTVTGTWFGKDAIEKASSQEQVIETNVSVDKSDSLNIPAVVDSVESTPSH